MACSMKGNAPHVSMWLDESIALAHELEFERKFQRMSYTPAPPAPDAPTMLTLGLMMNDGGNSISKMSASIADTQPTVSSNDFGEHDYLIGTELCYYGE